LRLRLFSIGGYGLALAELALVVFGAYDSYPFVTPWVENSVCFRRETQVSLMEG